MGWCGDPGQLEDVARRLDVLAGRTEEAGDRLAATVAGLPWHGAAADSFRRRAEERRRGIRSDAEALRHAARQVRALAEDVRGGVSALRRAAGFVADVVT